MRNARGDTAHSRFLATIALALSCAAAHAGHALFADGFELPAQPTMTAPFGAAPSPASVVLGFDSRPHAAEVYIGVDTTGSMAAELTALRSNGIVAAVLAVTCAGSMVACHADGDCGAGEVCVPEGLCRAEPVANRCLARVRTGAGRWDELNSYRNLASIQSDPTFAQSVLPASPLAGSAEAPFQPPSCVANPSLCPSAVMVCATTGVGCPGYGGAALRMYLQLTDADQQCIGATCSNYTAATAGNALRQAGIAFAGLWAGETDAGGAGTALGVAQSIATAAGSIDATLSPLTYNAVDAAAATAVRDAIRGLAYDRLAQLTLRIDDAPGDAVDIRAFFTRVEAISVDTADCDPSTRPLLDLEPPAGDGIPDAFETTLGARRCWRLDAIATNNQVAPTPNGAVYYGRATLLVDGVIPLDSRVISVVVPP